MSYFAEERCYFFFFLQEAFIRFFEIHFLFFCTSSINQDQILNKDTLSGNDSSSHL